MTCHCGETFGLPRPSPAGLSLQCPGCGAHADPGDRRCGYCDNPLRSVCCPNCYSLMFDGGKHCSRCGTRVIAPAVAVHRNGGSILPCPRCTTGLTANLIGNELFDRCDRCGGIWAHHAAIEGILRQKKSKHTVRQWLAELPTPAHNSVHDRVAAPCPDCEETMEQHPVSGNRKVIIDACGRHGIWFDYHEIRTLVGKLRATNRRKRRQYAPVRNRKQFAPFLDDDWWPWEALEDLLDFLKDLID